MDLSRVALTNLVNEIRRRSSASLVAVVLKDSSPEADVRIFPHADPRQEMCLLGLCDLAHDDARIAVRGNIMGPPDDSNPDKSL